MASRSLVLLALSAALPALEEAAAPLPTDPAVAAHMLVAARKEFKVARDEWKALSADERGVVKEARDAVEATARWRALAPAFGAAADLLEVAAAGNGAGGDVILQMAKSYRAMAEELDKDASYLAEELRDRAPAERAAATHPAAESLLASGVEAAPDEAATTAWECVKRMDPRYRALALNAKLLARGFATLDGLKHEERIATAIASAAKLHKATEPYFEGVKTSRREPPEPPPPPPKPRGPRAVKRVG